MSIILGISGSPRKANTDIILDKAMEGAASVDGTETRTIYLRQKNIKFCQGCFKCFDYEDENKICPVHRDDMDSLYPLLIQCDGLIIASPVYFGGVSAMSKNFMDRTEPLLRYGRGGHRAGLKDRVGGAVVVGGNRNGGLETTIQAIHHYFLIHDMIVVGTSTTERPGCYLGAAVTTHPERGMVKDAVKNDELGLKSAYMLGRRVAQVARWVAVAKEGNG